MSVCGLLAHAIGSRERECVRVDACEGEDERERERERVDE